MGSLLSGVIVTCTGALIVATSQSARSTHGRGLAACFVFNCEPEPSLVEQVHSHMMAWGLSGIALPLRAIGDLVLEWASSKPLDLLWGGTACYNCRHALAQIYNCLVGFFCMCAWWRRKEAPYQQLEEGRMQGNAKRGNNGRRDDLAAQDRSQEAAIRARALRPPRPPLGETVRKPKLLTIEELNVRAHVISWSSTVQKAELSPCAAAALALLRLLLWHLLQPCVFLAGLAVFWSDLPRSYVLASVLIAAREAWYALSALILALVQPSYLLVDIVSSWHHRSGSEGRLTLLMHGYRQRVAVLAYVCCPDKVVVGWLQSTLYVDGQPSRGGPCARRLAADLFALASFVLFVAAEVVGVALLGGLIADSRILGDSVASTVSMTDFWQLPLPIRIGFALAMISTVFGLALSCSRPERCPRPCKASPSLRWVSAGRSTRRPSLNSSVRARALPPRGCARVSAGRKRPGGLDERNMDLGWNMNREILA